ncbi:sigma-70 family RNA polymerase sigma factor [Paenibacillus sp. 1011MAR3C5]|uniref:sigma-70 family RNA polymerase sigma factor n=1 Tax=Paenibacillus sp. 1011MAR3C5 TaxID=1675787 RepID=UPI000E6CCB99|nr:sigma-70 family RNA polymerase sigma factor [Paenibacillus sp. 1011MAR3C5]RJE86135.1 sigma-70 family RNA polymerase sigma factor [Paenibacillus sp. 1011MAR3C5]
MEERLLRAWAVRMCEGDEAAFQSLFEATRAHTYSMIYYLVGSEKEAEDVMSEVYIALFRSLPLYDIGRPFLPWFNGLIIRQVRNQKRKVWRNFRLLEKAKAVGHREQGAVDAELEAINQKDEVLPYVKGLSHKLQEVIVLRYYQDYSLETIAEVLDLPLGTVKSRHHAALKKLRLRMGELADERGVSMYVH